MRFLIVGLGSIGERYVRNLLALGYRDISVVRRTARLPRTVDEHLFRTFLDIDDALATRPDAVVVANPTALHVPVALKAVRAGAHVLMEIPLSCSLEGVGDLIGEVEGRQTVVAMGYNLRFHPCLQRVREVVEGKQLGDVEFARAEFGEYLPACHPWEDYRTGYAARRDLGGGAVLTSSHEIDYLLWLLGPVAAVSAMQGAASGLATDVDDAMGMLMRHSRGALSEVHLDFVQPVYSRGCKIVCQRGAIEWRFRDNVVLQASHGDAGWEPILDLGGWEDFDFNATYLEEIREFVSSVESGRRPANDLRQGIEVLEVCLGILQSASTGQVVRFP